MNESSVLLKIYDIVGDSVWVSVEDGEKVHEKIIAAFNSGRTVNLSFANGSSLTAAFLNAAIGQLYGGLFSEQELRANLVFVDISDDDRKLVDRVIENAKRYFANRKDIDHLKDIKIDGVVHDVITVTAGYSHDNKPVVALDFQVKDNMAHSSRIVLSMDAVKNLASILTDDDSCFCHQSRR